MPQVARMISCFVFPYARRSPIAQPEERRNHPKAVGQPCAKNPAGMISESGSVRLRYVSVALRLWATVTGRSIHPCGAISATGCNRNFCVARTVFVRFFSKRSALHFPRDFVARREPKRHNPITIDAKRPPRERGGRESMAERSAHKILLPLTLSQSPNRDSTRNAAKRLS